MRRETIISAVGGWIFLAGDLLIALRFYMEPKWRLLLAGELIMPLGLLILVFAAKEPWARLLLGAFCAWVLFGAWKTLHMSALQRLTFH